MAYHARNGSIVNELTPFERLYSILPLGQMFRSIALAHFHPHWNGRLDRFYADLQEVRREGQGKSERELSQTTSAYRKILAAADQPGLPFDISIATGAVIAGVVEGGAIH